MTLYITNHCSQYNNEVWVKHITLRTFSYGVHYKEVSFNCNNVTLHHRDYCTVTLTIQRIYDSMDNEVLCKPVVGASKILL